MQKKNVLLYGANGYTGELIARYAGEYNLQPILAGRKEEKIAALAKKYQLPYRIFSLDDAAVLQQQLKDVQLVIHAAGPFSRTAKQMIEACIATQTHYIDINGDISVFEFIKTYDAAAKQANVMLLPGAGFDVIPTDCIALRLKNEMPDATHLQLAFISNGGGLSHGTATTMIQRIGEKALVRVNHQLVQKPLGHKSMWLDVDGQKRFVMSLQWGDISTAHHTTGIPNIEVFTGMKPTVYRLLKFQFLFNWLLRTAFIRKRFQQKIDAAPAGPTDEQRSKSKTFVWGKVWNAKGEERTASLQCGNGYSVTAWGCLYIAQQIVQGKFKAGYQTPAAVYGESLIYQLPDSKQLS
ncbi:MAG: saccharopine dehydrogenase family protein [Lacibacter sp.]